MSDPVQLHGCVSLNGEAIYQGELMPMTWSADNCTTLINATLGGDELRTIEVLDLDCPPKTASELLEVLIA